MNEASQNMPPAESMFDGVGQSVDAAVLDAIKVAAGSKTTAEVKFEVVDWGISITGIGGARSFWARVRVID